MLNRPRNIKRIFKNYFFILRQVWKVAPGYLVLLILIAIVGAILPIVPLYLMKVAIDFITAGINSDISFQSIIFVLALAGAVNFFANFTNSVRSYFSNLTVSLIEKHINLNIYKKAAETSLNYVESRDYYIKLDNVRRALGRRWDTLVLAPVNLFAHCFTLLSLIGILLSLKWWIAALLLIGVMPNVLIQIKMRDVMNNFYTSQVEENRKISYLERILTDKYFSKELRLFKLKDIMLEKISCLIDKRNVLQNNIRKKEMKLLGWGAFASFVTVSFCQIYLAFQIFMYSVTIGEWQLYNGAIQSIIFNLNTAFNIIANSYEEELFSNVLTEYMELKSEDDYTSPHPISILEVPKVIELKNVYFCYPDSDEYIINDLNLVINRGDKLALVGLNGAGKSTLVRIICGLYYPIHGEVLFDGIDVRKIKREDIYNLFGLVFQDFAQYAFTVEENITISNSEEYNYDQMLCAVTNSGIKNRILELPNQYQTFITKDYEKNGTGNLSGGEWQKIAIARCFYKNASFVILDEPTSNLDPIAEYEVYQNFTKLVSEKTSIIISHRLSSVKMADKIVFLENGSICEMGSHHDLMNAKGKYAKLFKLQAEQYSIPHTDSI